jgi:CDP-4-dehydro-6-deoxyglucose reductase
MVIAMAQITIIPDKIEFNVVPEQTVLDAGLAQKLNLPHSCKNGVCGACKSKLVSGEVRLDTYNPKTLTSDDIKQGYTLLCKAHAVTDLVLDIPNVLDGFPIKIMPSKVISVDKIHNTAIINLKLPANLIFGFHAGQYVEIMFKGKTRSYSIASSPLIPNEIELHTKYHKGGEFSEYVWNELKTDSLVRFKGPMGAFKLQKSDSPIIFVCTGTGFAPVKSIIETLYLSNDSREIHLYWGNRTVDDFYLTDILGKWQSTLNIKVIRCLSKDSQNQYFNGYVTDALKIDFNNLTDYDLYACGNPQMIEDVFELASEKLGLARDRFFSDAFTPAVV